MEPIFFAKATEFRRWLEKHHDSAPEVLVGFHKKGSGRPSMTWPEAVDEALCFGWIDGVRRRIDEESYANRFTPRRKGSNWSAINVGRVQELIKQGRMRPAGLRAFEERREDRSGVYSYEQRREATLGKEFERELRANRKAWRFFQAQPPGYRATATWWVVSARREDTRRRRLGVLIEHSERGEPIPPLTRPSGTR
jgi:uncharacterized protein YdeI (YjbR/CyaY-like superfamily)